MRIEEDSIGRKEIDDESYFGVQSLRAKENFQITGQKLQPEFIDSLVLIKKACAITNCEAGILNENIKDAIVLACDKILEGKYKSEFIVDPIQGGAGTSMNMNANEVISNIAIEILGGKKGDYKIVHPNDHVNFGQSTNDVIPSAGKLTALKLIDKLLLELKELEKSFNNKSDEFKDVLKMGRTQMQDAVPITLGQEFKAYESFTTRAYHRIEKSKEELLELNMGGTAIGTGINADLNYFNNIVPKIGELSGYNFRQAKDLIDGTQNIDCFSSVSGCLKSVAMGLSKIGNDLRLMSSGPRTGFSEISLPSKQNGSSIMPGKVNPVIPEVLNQASFRVLGNDVTISLAVEAGQLELNAFEPVIFYSLFESIKILTNAINTFRINCVDGILVNEKKCKEHIEKSILATPLCPHIGYKEAASLAKESLKTDVSIKELVLSRNLMKEEDLDVVLEAKNLTTPGISGKELLKK